MPSDHHGDGGGLIVENVTLEDLCWVIGLHMAGYFGKNRRVALAKMERMHKGGILLYWSQSSSATGVFKTPTVVKV